MTEAAKRIIKFAFNDLNLNRINVSAAVENQASNATIQKLGFVFECTKRQAIRSKASNKLHDINEYGMLREDFRKSSAKK